MNYYLRSVTEEIYVNHFQEWPIKSPMHAFPSFSLPSYQINVKCLRAKTKKKKNPNMPELLIISLQFKSSLGKTIHFSKTVITSLGHS